MMSNKMTDKTCGECGWYRKNELYEGCLFKLIKVKSKSKACENFKEKEGKHE